MKMLRWIATLFKVYSRLTTATLACLFAQDIGIYLALGGRAKSDSVLYRQVGHLIRQSK